MDAILVAGLGFGDEGKGSIVDYLCRTLPTPTLVVRYNGGAQAAHNVVTPSGQHHTFAQFGSGTFAGAPTLLSRHMLVNPVNLITEEAALKYKGIDPRIFIEEEALVTNYFQVFANRAREAARGYGRHGSCGLGIGETVADFLKYPEQALRVQDLKDQKITREKLAFSRDLKVKEFGLSSQGIDALDPFGKGRIDYYVDLFAEFAAQHTIVDRTFLKSMYRSKGTVIFEGAQGVLLDQDYGFHPHTTWSNTTFDNAYDLLQGFTGPIARLGVLRAYHTRHGEGPFPTEDRSPHSPLRAEPHNTWGAQGDFRAGPFDAVLGRYALEVIGGVDGLAITCLDRIPPDSKICICYMYDTLSPVLNLAPKKLDDQMIEFGSPLTNLVKSSVPGFEEVKAQDLVEKISHELRVPVLIESYGPTWTDKKRYLF